VMEGSDRLERGGVEGDDHRLSVVDGPSTPNTRL
jgi:hypothetical protein